MYWLFEPEESFADEIEDGENFAGLLNRKRSKSIKLKAGIDTNRNTAMNNTRKE